MRRKVILLVVTIFIIVACFLHARATPHLSVRVVMAWRVLVAGMLVAMIVVGVIMAVIMPMIWGCVPEPTHRLRRRLGIAGIIDAGRFCERARLVVTGHGRSSGPLAIH